MKHFYETQKRWEARRHRAGVKSVGTILFAMSMGATIDEAKSVAAQKYPEEGGDRSDSAFFKGRNQRWFEEGQKDAADGSYRGHLYREQPYDLGWHDLVGTRAKKGWTNDPLMEDAKRHAWESDPDLSGPINEEEGSMEKTSLELFAEIEAHNELRKRA